GEDAGADASDPVLHAGPVLQLCQDAGGVVDERVGEIQEPQASSRTPKARGASRNAFAPRRSGRVAVRKRAHLSFGCSFGEATSFIAWSAARCSSRPWMESLIMFRFMLSHASSERSSVMRFSTSFGSKVGTAMPGIGTPSGPHSRRNISNG